MSERSNVSMNLPELDARDDAGYCKDVWCQQVLSVGNKARRGMGATRSASMKPPKSKPEPAYLTPAEVAEILRVDRRTVYEWLRSGKLKAVRFGDTWRIPRKVVLPDN